MKRIKLVLLLVVVSITSFSQERDEENELLRKSLQEQSERGKALFAGKEKGNVAQKSVVSSEPKVKQPEANVESNNESEIEKLNESLKEVSERIESLAKKEEISHQEEVRDNPLMWKVINLIDGKDDEVLANLCDSILELGKLSEEVIAVSHLIREYANTYEFVPYEMLSSERVIIRQFVTFFNDPAPKPSGTFYCNVWDTSFVYCYPGQKFDMDEPMTFTLVDFSHRYHPPCDPYLGDPGFPNKKAVSRGYADHGKLSSDGKTFVTDGEYIHGGTDLRFNPGDVNPKIYAVFDGVVRSAKYNGKFGYVIVIRHYNGLESVYGHNDKLLVKSGDHVRAGDVIAHGGNSGHGTARHLHFELSFRGRRIDAESFINFANNPMYNNHGVPAYHLFGWVIQVFESGESEKDKYKTHQVKVLTSLNTSKSKAFMAESVSPAFSAKELTKSSP